MLDEIGEGPDTRHQSSSPLTLTQSPEIISAALASSPPNHFSSISAVSATGFTTGSRSGTGAASSSGCATGRQWSMGAHRSVVGVRSIARLKAHSNERLIHIHTHVPGEALVKSSSKDEGGGVATSPNPHSESRWAKRFIAFIVLPTLSPMALGVSEREGAFDRFNVHMYDQVRCTNV